MKKLFILPLLLFCGCAELKPSWQGLWAGPQVVAPFNADPIPELGATAVIGLGRKNSLQIGVWGSENSRGYYLGLSRRLF